LYVHALLARSVSDAVGNGQSPRERLGDLIKVETAGRVFWIAHLAMPADQAVIGYADGSSFAKGRVAGC
jgi:hypothetical protein